MRKVLFHGITKNEPINQWVEGFYSCFVDETGELKHYIQTVTESGKRGQQYEVEPDSVGEYIGIEYEGQRLFEGDLMRFESIDDYAIGVIRLQGGEYIIKGLHSETQVGMGLLLRKAVKVGTEFDNPYWCDEEKLRFLERAKLRRTLRNIRSVAYPLNFWTAALQKEIKRAELPPDWEQAVEELCKELDKLDSRYPIILKEYFQNHQTCEAVGLQIELTSGGVLHHVKRMLRLIRQTPELKGYLLDGIKK